MFGSIIAVRFCFKAIINYQNCESKLDKIFNEHSLNNKINLDIMCQILIIPTYTNTWVMLEVQNSAPIG